MKKWKRKCPECGEEISYTRKSDRNRAEIKNTNCRSCSLKGKKRKSFTNETRKRMSNSHKGQVPWNKGLIKETDERVKKNSESNKGRKRSKETKLKMRKNNAHYWKGKTRTEETKLKIRLSMIKRNGITFPNYNPDACRYINEYNKKYGFNFQHAENGGEVNIDGYFPDGIDEKRKTIIEVDEPRHYDKNGNLKQKDVKRQKYLEGLGYKVIRVRI